MLLLVPFMSAKITGCNELLFDCKTHRLRIRFASRRSCRCRLSGGK